MGRSWHSATSLAQSHSHSSGATIRLVGNKVPWTGVKSESPMTLAVVNSRKCKTRKKSVYKTTGSGLHVDRATQQASGLDFFVFFPEKFSELKKINHEKFMKRNPTFSGSINMFFFFFRD